ncbi:hypothetical protein AB6E53_11795 [Vibrio breoganii]
MNKKVSLLTICTVFSCASFAQGAPSFSAIAEVVAHSRICQEAMTALEEPELAEHFKGKSTFGYKVAMELYPQDVDHLTLFVAQTKQTAIKNASTYDDWDKVNLNFRCINTYIADQSS